MPKRKHTPATAVPLEGGVVTARDAGQLPHGSFSTAQNVRPRHPGFIKRPGQRTLHTTADGTNKVMTLYQFRKQRVDEKHFFAQMSDNDVLGPATTEPPGVTTGVFGVEAFSGSASSKPAAWAVNQDLMFFSNGVDSHQVYGGNSSYVERCVVYKGTATIPRVPEEGFDYSDEIHVSDTSKVADFSNVGTDTDNAIMIGVPIPIKSLTFDLVNLNDNAAIMTISYWKNDSTWADTSNSDGTDVGGDTFKQDGTCAWTMPSDEMPLYAYGRSMFWYRITFNAALDATVSCDTITWDTDWQNITNLWDGVLAAPVEVWTEKAADDKWSVYGSAAVTMDSLGIDQKILLFCADPIEAVYIDIGKNPTTDATSLTDVRYWDGDSWNSSSTELDGTSGLSNSGWITFARESTVQPQQFQGSLFYSYVYELTFGTAMPATMEIAIQVQPYFDIDELGKGYTCATWKDRSCYSFDLWPTFVYVSATNLPMTINGSDFGLLRAGDGRQHKIAGMRSMYNELIVWQEEKGLEGGTITLFQGYTPTTFGKLLLSTRVGAMNDKCIQLVDGVRLTTGTDVRVRTVAYFLSRYGLGICDGRVVEIISDDIGNYFDQSRAECIRRGYEQEMWLKLDTAHNVIRMGIVSGASATVPNVFPVYDLITRSFYFDSLGQELSCMAEVESASSWTYGGSTFDPPVVQVGGGVDDGLVYQLNYGQNDVSMAITSHITIELDGRGEYLTVDEFILRCKAQAAGNITITVTANGIEKVSAKALSMIAEVATQATRRHRAHLNVVSQHIAVKIEHSTASQDMDLYDIGISTTLWQGR